MTNRTDTFNRSDGALGTPSDAGSDWTIQAGTWAIASNRASSSLVGIASLESSAADVSIEVTVPVIASGGNGYFGIAARVADDANYIRCGFYQDGNLLVLAKFIASANTNLAIPSYTAVAGDVLRLDMSGNNFEVFVNDVSKISVTDSNSLSSNTKHGLMQIFANYDVRWDDFSITELGGGGSSVGAGLSAGILTGGRLFNGLRG